MPVYEKRRCVGEGCPVDFVPKRHDQKYHDRACQDRNKARRAAARKAGVVPGRKAEPESADGRTSARRGAGYEAFCGSEWPERLRRRDFTAGQAAYALGTSEANVSRWMAAWLEDEMRAGRQAGWARSEEIEALLDDFAAFRARFFKDEWGKPYVTEPYHQKWIDALIDAMENGGRLLILSPPRHGKTQLLIHFCVWLIIRRPNIRIVWIGLNEDNAKEAVGAALDILENDEALLEAVLGPEGKFKPGTRTNKSWSSEKFTVATREGTGIKSPTMRAVGKRGKLLSKDADLVIGDDIQDREAYESPDARVKDINWWNSQVSSRKEAHTAILCIGSRQHHEDLYGRLIKNVQWDSIVESAHDVECSKPVHPMYTGEKHLIDCPVCAEHADCVLWPVKRTMAYLQDQRAAMEDDEMFEMVYLNVTRPAGEQYVTADEIEQCKDRSRTIGRYLDQLDSDGKPIKQVLIPPGTRLIAGLDPAYRGFQAAVLWAYHPDTKVRYLMDLDNRKAGGLPGARHIIQEWHDLYGCCFWVIERNGYQEAITGDVDIVNFCSRNGIHLEPSFTDGFNKWDPNFGVTKQMSLFRNDPPLIDLPWGDEETRGKVRLIINQWLNFEPAIGRNVKSKTKSDLQMAGWLPETTIRRWRRDQQNDIQDDFSSSSSQYTGGLGDRYVGIMGDAA